MHTLIQNGSSGTPLLFYLVQSSDHITGLTGASPTVTISKNGGSFASPSGAVSEIANGWYKVAGNATDTNTNGPIALHATATSGDPTDCVPAQVVGFDPTQANLAANVIQWNSTNVATPATAGVVEVNIKNIANAAVSTTTAQLGVNVVKYNNQTAQTDANNLPKVDLEDIAGAAVSTSSAQLGVNIVNIAGSAAALDANNRLKVDVDDWNGTTVGALPANFSSLVIDSNGRVKIQHPLQRNTAANNFQFTMTDNVSHALRTGLSVTAQRSIDGAAFANCANAVTEVANGTYKINFANTDLNGSFILFRFSATGADDTDILIPTFP